MNIIENSHYSIISAIVYSIVGERFEAPDPRRDLPHNRAVRFLLAQHGRMADYLRWPLVALTLAFDWSSIPRHGRRFHRLAPAARARKIEAWRGSRLGACRDFIRFHESLVVFYWYSEAGHGDPAGAAAGGSRPLFSGVLRILGPEAEVLE